MKRSRSLNPSFVVLCVLTLILLVHPASTILAEKSGLQSAWERARDVGTYDFIADCRPLSPNRKRAPGRTCKGHGARTRPTPDGGGGSGLIRS